MKIRFLVNFGFMMNLATAQVMIPSNNVGSAALPVVVAFAVCNPEQPKKVSNNLKKSEKFKPTDSKRSWNNNSVSLYQNSCPLHQPLRANHKRSKKA